MWRDLRRAPPEPMHNGLPIRSSYQKLERALSALDMFVITNDVGDMDHVGAQRSRNPDILANVHGR